MQRLVFSLILSLACAACNPKALVSSSALGASPTSTVSSQPMKRATSARPAAPDAAADVADTAPPLAGELKGLAAGNNAFALDLFAEIRAQKGNLAFSPICISTALRMVTAGARGETAAQMQKVLRLDGTTEHVLDITGNLLASYRDPALRATVHFANGLFAGKNYTFQQAFVDRTGAVFNAPLELLDFKHSAEDARQHINAWVSETTQDRIKDLIPPGSVNAKTRLVMANAIYFRGDWSLPFIRQFTTAAPFHVAASNSKDVPTMHQVRESRFAAIDGVKLLEMPYEGGALAMTLVLPDKVDGLDALDARLSQAVFDRWLEALAMERVDVALPRVKIDPASSVTLDNALKALGMTMAFDRDNADFTGIASSPLRDDRLYLDHAFHKAFVTLDEKGTEAAAASGAIMVVGRRAPPPKPKAEFHADHPFLFFLRDLRSGMILVMGRVSDPAVP